MECKTADNGMRHFLETTVEVLRRGGNPKPKGLVYGSIYEWLLANGRPFEAGMHWTSAQEDLLMRIRSRVRPRPKEC